MAFIRKEGQGSLFENERQNERQPNYRGVIVINGKEYELAAWERTSQRGTHYLSLQASEPKSQSEEDKCISTSNSLAQKQSLEQEEDIPF